MRVWAWDNPTHLTKLETQIFAGAVLDLDWDAESKKIVAAGEAGAGMVKAIVNGKKKLISLEIDPAILSSSDKVLVQDLVVAAVNKAMEEAEVLAKEELKKSTEGILPNIPGLDLTSMMG